MEQVTTSQPVITEQTAVTEPAKVSAKKSITKMVNVNEYVSKDATTLHSFDLADFAKGIGQILSKIDSKADFSYLGKKFVVPALTANNSNPERAAILFKQLIANVFPANMERIEVIPGTSEAGKAILSLKSAGFKFKAVCKVQVAEAVNVWLKNKRAKLNLHKETVRGLNAELIAQTNVINETVKELKADNLAAITGFEKKVVKQLEK